MIDMNTVRQISNAPIEERFQIIEVLLQSLKNDIRPKLKPKNGKYKYFKIHKFSLGAEVHVDRDELYSERGL
jgi:hypothetical protein